MRTGRRKEIFMGLVRALFLVVFVVQISPGQVTIPADRAPLLNGEGMGLALSAELTGYPGPKHVLELRAKLGLTQDQTKKVETLVDLTRISAVAKGEEIVEAEEELHSMFQSGSINDRTLRVQLEKIGKLRAELRHIHLQAHLRMKQILNKEQVSLYNDLRGYESH
jgi:Spy/CpxP family protein refolding chaperone